MTPDSLLNEDWNQTRERLGGAATLATGARETKAFAWGRKIPTPTVLLRLVGAMLGDDQRRRLGEVKYLPRHVIHRHRRAQWFATPGASLWIMIDDGVGVSNLVSRHSVRPGTGVVERTIRSTICGIQRFAD
jgi:hypothetical protein